MNGSDRAYPNGERNSGGLTKRELFAAMAMQGILTNDFTVQPFEAAEHAVVCADALIRKLSKEEK